MSRKVSALMLCAGLSLGLSVAGPACGSEPAKASNQADNSGRQVALLGAASRKHASALSKNPTLISVHKSAASHSEKTDSSGLLAQIEKGWPPTVQDAADRGCNTARNCMHVVAARLDQFGKWLAHLDQQMNSMPVATPLGSPYVTRSDRHLRLAPDGRVRTVVQQ